MRLLLLPGIAVLLGAGTALACAAEPSLRTGADRADVHNVSGAAGPRLAGGPATVLADVSPAHIDLSAGRLANRPTCMGLPATQGGVGTDGDDVIIGTPGKDVIVAGDGNDVIHGRNGKDTICGGPGDDTLVGGRNPADWSRAKHGDRLSGGSGEDRIVDNWGYRDKLLGGSGNDRVRSRNGIVHELNGGPGADRLVSDDGGDNVLLGGPGDDVLQALTGWGYGRYHAGEEGRDTIDVGPDGDLTVSLTGDGDHLTVHGDAYVVPTFWRSPVGIHLDMAAGTARRVGADPADPPDLITFLAPEEVAWLVYGSNHDDVLSGTYGDDAFFATRGNDTLFGLGGNDGLYGFQGDDVIYGGEGDDHSLAGGPGDDLIDGGEGDDSAAGGKGTDTCLNAEEVATCEQ